MRTESHWSRYPELLTTDHAPLERIAIGNDLPAERSHGSDIRFFVQDASVEECAAAWRDTLASVRSIQLPPLVEHYIAAYEEVGHRGAFLWRWCWRGVEETSLPLVPAEWKEHLLTTKLLAIILNVLLDDLADQRGSEALLEKALSIPFHPQGRAAPAPEVPPEERCYFALIADLWHALEERVRELPHHQTYRALYVFDYQQVFNSMRHSVLTRNRPTLHNLAENRAYSPHNMNMMVFATLDMMAAAVKPVELGTLREAVWYAQSMGQIANMTATWRREVTARDFSSRVFVQALDAGVVTAEQLQSLPPEVLTSRIESSGMEERLLAEWREQRQRLEVLRDRVRSFDMAQLIRGVDTLLDMHLAARGFI